MTRYSETNWKPAFESASWHRVIRIHFDLRHLTFGCDYVEGFRGFRQASFVVFLGMKRRQVPEPAADQPDAAVFHFSNKRFIQKSIGLQAVPVVFQSVEEREAEIEHRSRPLKKDRQAKLPSEFLESLHE